MVGQDPILSILIVTIGFVKGKSMKNPISWNKYPLPIGCDRNLSNYIWFETPNQKPIEESTIRSKVIQIQNHFRDVTERIQVQTQLKYDALHDTINWVAQSESCCWTIGTGGHRRLNALKIISLQFSFLDLDR
jgi:hypothetical protein